MNVSFGWQNRTRRLLRDERALRALVVVVAAIGVVQGGWALWTEGPGAAAARLLVAANDTCAAEAFVVGRPEIGRRLADRSLPNPDSLAPKGHR